VEAHPTPEALDQQKRNAATAALRWVRDGMILGLGSGSTAAHFVAALGMFLRSGDLAVRAVASSNNTEKLARAAGIPLLTPNRGQCVDLTVDGADEIAPDLSLLKGRGGALLREKVLARAARFFLVIVDSSKPVDRLGVGPLPVEVIPFALPWVWDRLEAMGARVSLRSQPGLLQQPFLTDQKNYILDCRFGIIENPSALDAGLRGIPGIVEHGLFLGCVGAALIGDALGVLLLRPDGVSERMDVASSR
jgi:ribose 5-phosphate isomerase A